MEYEFFSCGIPLKEWYDRKPELESALNMEIGEIKYSSGKWLIKISTVEASNGLPSKINWNENYIKYEDFTLNLGKSIIGNYLVNLNKIPHLLIAGSTGSGKSVLLRNILHQCILKDACVILADFKGGVDYGQYFKDNCLFVTDIDNFIEILEGLVDVLNDRKMKFAELGASNLREYNKINIKGDKKQRIIIAIDEIGEVLDKTGLDKIRKAKVLKVEESLATIARLGRAFGLNLILSTQRPDANILSGQIRNNIDGRYCGRADDVLSKIALDNTLASDIPKYEQGMFVAQDGTVFRGYFFDENSLYRREQWRGY